MKKTGYILLAAALAFIVACRLSLPVADFYATRLYPGISAVLSALASPFPFPLEELTGVALLTMMIVTAVRSIRRRDRWHRIVFRELTIVAWIFVWFYLGWGLNYNRSSLSQRLETPLARYDEARFRTFLDDYVRNLNANYTPDFQCPESLEAEVKAFYAGRRPECGLSSPRSWQHPKRALATWLFSKVGVTGSMGPFFSESLLNGDMPASEYPFTYAHEFSHLMGVSSEAEANFWAFRFCADSEDEAIRYSGYFTMLGNVLANARALLSADEYRVLLDSIMPEVKDDYNARAEFWSSKYSRVLGKIQDVMYNAYLKGNRISSGTKNYNEVVALLLTDFSI